MVELLLDRDLKRYILVVTCILITIIPTGCAILEKPAPVQKSADILLSAPAISFSKAIEKAMSAVVYIYVEKNKQAAGKPVYEGGSGVILRPDGWILTNRHVIEDAKDIQVILNDRIIFKAVKVVPAHLMDLAAIKIEAKNLTVAKIGDADKLKSGDIVLALGNPLGASPVSGQGSSTMGIVSKKGVSFTIQGVPYYDVIQTDAAINTGNSGGPLINTEGEVVGINSAHALFAQNVGYAISINMALPIFNDLADLGAAEHPYMGIIAEDMTTELRRSEVSLLLNPVITNVEEGTPSYAAGLKAGDIILMVNDTQIETVTELTKTIWRLHIGDRIIMTVQRGDQTLEVHINSIKRPPDEPLDEL